MAKKRPRRTTTKKKDRPKVTKTPISRRQAPGAPDTSQPAKDFAKKYTSKSPSSPLKVRSEQENTARELDAMINRERPRGGGADFGTIPASTIGVPRPTGMPAHLTYTPSAGFGGTPPSIPTTIGGAGGIDGLPLDGLPLNGDIPPVVDGGEDGEGDGKEEKKFFIKGVGMVNKRLNDYYQGLLKRMNNEEAIKRVKLKQIEDEWAEKNLVDLMSGEGIKRLVTKDFKAGREYENKFLGSAGAANILNQLDKIKGRDDAETAQLKQAYVNQILAANPEGASEMFGIDLQYGNITPDSFEKTLVSSNQGNKNFDKNYYKTVGAYWDVNTPQTSGDLDDMATAYQQGNLKMTKANTLAIQQAVEQKRGSTRPWDYDVGGGQQTDPTDPTDTTDPTDYPYGNLTFDVYGRPIKKYDYTGGPEQLYLGGGWKKDGSYIGSPWGPNPHQPSFKEGGIANFRPYGY